MDSLNRKKKLIKILYFNRQISLSFLLLLSIPCIAREFLLPVETCLTMIYKYDHTDQRIP